MGKNTALRRGLGVGVPRVFIPMLATLGTRRQLRTPEVRSSHSLPLFFRRLPLCFLLWRHSLLPRLGSKFIRRGLGGGLGLRSKVPSACAPGTPFGS